MSIRETFEGKIYDTLKSIKEFVKESNLDQSDFSKLNVDFQLNPEQDVDMEDFTELYEYLKEKYEFAALQFEVNPLKTISEEVELRVQLKYIN